MRIQKIRIRFLMGILIAFFTTINAICFADNTNQFAVNVPYERHNYREECSDLPMHVRRFTDKLSEANLKIFCSQFNNDQREKAMQMANQKDKNGNFVMTPDEAVEKVARTSK